MIVSIIQRGDFYLSGNIMKQKKDIVEKSGLPVEEFVKIEAYRNCNHAN